jgi:tetrahydromethanopterin S-methyltransferase subunit F
MLFLHLPLLLSVPGLAPQLHLCLISSGLLIRHDPSLRDVGCHVTRLAGLLIGSLLTPRLYRPVKDIVVLETFAHKEVTEELAKIRVVGLVIETERSAVVEVNSGLVGEATAQNLGRSRHLCGLLVKAIPGHDSGLLFSMMRSYFCFLVAAFSPCQGS